MKQKASYTVELRARQLEYLSRMTEAHSLPDVSKALRILVSYAMAMPDQESAIFDTIRCASPAGCDAASGPTSDAAGSPGARPEVPRMASIIPCFRYADAPAAIRFLCEAFGFHEHLVVPGEDGTIAHAQLTYRNGMIMLGSQREDEYGAQMKTPAQAGGNTGAPCIVVDDIDAHYERARAAGASVVMPLESQDYGGKLYSCTDPEGYLWNFGSYDPWAEV